MHHSRFCALVFDCEGADADVAARFWGGALGKPVEPPSPEHPTYRGLATGIGEPMMLVQIVDHPSRVHVDVETDALDAEVARLEKLGARRVGFVKRWWVMEAPTGQRFCVVKPQRGPLDATNANVWP